MEKMAQGILGELEADVLVLWGSLRPFDLHFLLWSLHCFHRLQDFSPLLAFQAKTHPPSPASSSGCSFSWGKRAAVGLLWYHPSSLVKAKILMGYA